MIAKKNEFGFISNVIHKFEMSSHLELLDLESKVYENNINCISILKQSNLS